MANILSVNVTNITANPITALDPKVAGPWEVIDTLAVATTAIDDTNDLLLFGPVPSNCIVKSVKIRNDDLDSNGTPALAANWGVYYSGIGGTQARNGNTIGTVVDADLFASADTSLQAAVANWSEITNESGNYDASKVQQELWQAAGLSADPGGLLLIGAKPTAAAATAAAGDVSVLIEIVHN